jgi:hypothetical protein
MSADPELDRLLAERDAMLKVYKKAMQATKDATRYELWTEDVYYNARFAYNRYETRKAYKEHKAGRTKVKRKKPKKSAPFTTNQGILSS